MRELSREEFLQEVMKGYHNKDNGEKYNVNMNMQDIVLSDLDLSGVILRDTDFSWASFHNICFDGADFSGCILKNTLFDNCSLRATVFRNADLESSALRGADMRGCDLRGANMFCSVLEKAKLEGCISDESTRFFRLYCPEKGAFIGYKKCCDNRIVELLIPADAKRTSATRNSCRCSKAKVLVIKSTDCSVYFEEAWSTVDENFVYRTGQWVEVPDFDEDRWNDSTTGIHFWMTREDAVQY